jgi:hypothetical protein
MSKIVVLFIVFIASCCGVSGAPQGYNNALDEQLILECLEKNDIEVIQALLNDREIAHSIEGYFGSYQFIAPLILIAAVAGSCCLYQCMKNKIEEVLRVRLSRFIPNQEAG